MRLLAWNVNHRAKARRIPRWIARAIADASSDVVVLTEYMLGADHDQLVAELIAQGLAHVSISKKVDGQNQILIATRDAHRLGHLAAPSLHEAVPSNVLHVVLEGSHLHVVGVRIPAFTGKGAMALKRATWDWLLSGADALVGLPAVIAGDLNTALGDRQSYCGDCLQTLVDRSWKHALPQVGHSWASIHGVVQRQIDHAFLSPALLPLESSYSWQFRTLDSEAMIDRVGHPDHAMLLIDFDAERARR